MGIHNLQDPRDRAEFVHQVWPAQASQLAPIRAQVRRWLAPLGLPDDDRDDLVLVVSEAATNAIEHAYPAEAAGGTVDLTFWIEARRVHIEIVDHGRWQPPRAQPTGRGLGIQLMHRLTESVLIHYDRRGTRVLLSHRLAA